MWDPFSTQGWNRYSYVGNSPLNFTDPSGYCFLGCFWKPVFKAVEQFFQKNFAALIQVAATALLCTGPTAPICAGVVAFAVTGVTSGDLGLALRAGATAFFTAGAMDAVGTATTGHKIPDFMSSAHLANMAGHALVGCASSVMQGGKCGPGALSGAAGSFAGPILKDLRFERNLVAHAVVGGVASVAAGGNFANGAVTASFGYLFNALGSEGAAARRQAAGQQVAYCAPCVPPIVAFGQFVVDAIAVGLELYALTSDPLYQGGTATIWADGGHLSIQVQYGSSVSHTELLGEPGDIAEVARATQPGRPLTNPIPLPNAAGAIGFAEGMVGQEYGPYDIKHNSCYTYCSDVLRAGGLNVGPQSSGLYQAIKPYLK